jgi:hypothetical protein
MPENIAKEVFSKKKNCKEIIKSCSISKSLDCSDIYRNYFHGDYHHGIPINIAPDFFNFDKLMCRSEDPEKQEICNRFYKLCFYFSKLAPHIEFNDMSYYPIFSHDEIIEYLDLNQEDLPDIFPFFSIEQIGDDEYGEEIIENNSLLCCEFVDGKWGILAYSSTTRSIRWYYNNHEMLGSEDRISELWNSRHINLVDLTQEEEVICDELYIAYERYDIEHETIFPKLSEDEYIEWNDLTEPHKDLLNKIGINQQLWESMLWKIGDRILINAGIFKQLVLEGVVPFW